jgi:hypothetical protein
MENKKKCCCKKEVVAKQGSIYLASSKLNLSDYIGAFKARFGINRNSYSVEPGLYALGNANKKSPVLVTANYKLTFDSLRKHLTDIDCWILVLDTKGINVWCAAGKGAFGTAELINRIVTSDLENVIDHKKIILPQLGAVGVSAYEIKKQTGFKVVYGPVRAEDLPVFLEDGMKATSEMRLVKFGLYDRLVLAPIEFVMSLKYLFYAIFAIAIISGFKVSSSGLGIALFPSIYYMFGVGLAYVSGAIFGPVLLPFLPGRSFSLKGFWLGVIVAFFFCINFYGKISLIGMSGLLLVMVTIASFLVMNFTGASTYTSLSGVQKEMKIALPLQISAIVIGLLLIVVARFI